MIKRVKYRHFGQVVDWVFDIPEQILKVKHLEDGKVMELVTNNIIEIIDAIKEPLKKEKKSDEKTGWKTGRIG